MSDTTLSALIAENLRLDRQVRRLEMEQQLRDEVIDAADQIIRQELRSRKDVEEYYRRKACV